MFSFSDCKRARVLISELLVRQLLSSFPDLDLAVGEAVVEAVIGDHERQDRR